MSHCALCHLFAQPRVPVITPVGLLTSRADILAAATARLGTIDGEEHVMVPVCPEHVVDIYRGRIPGVRMAWRLNPGDSPAATAARQGREAGSAFPA